jgi:hypothetical protein
LHLHVSRKVIIMNHRRQSNELPIPPAAIRDRDSIEVLRVWMTAGALRCSVRPGIWVDQFGVDEPTGWAVLISDTIRHSAEGLSSRLATNPGEFIREVKRVLDSGLDALISVPSSFQDRSASSLPRRARKQRRGLLPIPTIGGGDRDSFELMRFWCAGGDRQGSVKLGNLPHPVPYHLAIILSDVARQIADAITGHNGQTAKDTLRSMKRVINSELGGKFEDLVIGSGDWSQDPSPTTFSLN